LEAALQSEFESVAVTELVESLKSVTPPSIEEVNKTVSIKSLSEFADSLSVKTYEGEVIDRGSTAGVSHLN